MNLYRTILSVLIASRLACADLLAEVTYKVNSLEDFDRFFQDVAISLEPKAKVFLSGFLTEGKIKNHLDKTICFDYVSEYEYTKRAGGAMGIKLEYYDSTRLLAAYRNPEKLRKLSGYERRALDEFQKRVKRFKTEGMSRQAIVQVILDDTRLRTQPQWNDNQASSCSQFIIQNKGGSKDYAHYLFLMFSAHDVPCRIVRAFGRSWNMVQMENGNWYHVAMAASWLPLLSDNQQFTESAEVRNSFAVSNMLRENSMLELYPKTPDVNLPNLPVYKEQEDFWKAAEKAYMQGKPAFGGLMRSYPGKKKFMRFMGEFLLSGHTVGVKDTYLPVKAASNAYVWLIFNRETGAAEEPQKDDAESLQPTHKKSLKQFKKLPETENE